MSAIKASLKVIKYQRVIHVRKKENMFHEGNFHLVIGESFQAFEDGGDVFRTNYRFRHLLSSEGSLETSSLNLIT